MTEKQKTIAQKTQISGVGVHSGNNVSCIIYPAPENHGIVFKRNDIEEQPLIPADVDFVSDVSRGTTLENKGVKVKTVEHFMAAVAGLGIDNLLVELDNSELPILDGSAKQFVDILLKAGITEQNADKNYFEISETFTLANPEKNSEYIVLPHPEFELTVMIDYNSPVLGCQHATLKKETDFVKEFASCRTFSFLHELEYLLNNNLIKGGDLKNALVVIDKVLPENEMKRIASLFNQPAVHLEQPTILATPPLYFPNEPARHKLLDLFGDLALIGKNLKCRIIATRPGHASNVELAKRIKQIIKASRNKPNVPKYDPSAKPLIEINQIKRLLPHRPPFLFVDKIIEMDDTHIVGIKNVTINEAFFTGHFPDDPVLPGVIQIETMAQVGGIFVLNSVPDPENYETLFAKIENARFKQKVVPGDTMIFRLELASPIRRGMCHMKGEAYVGDKVVLEAEMLAQIARKNR